MTVARRFTKVALLAWLVPVFVFAGDDTDLVRRPTLGFRIEAYPTSAFATDTVQVHTAVPLADYTYYGSSAFAKAAVGPIVEYRITRRLSIATEFHVRAVSYTQEAQVRNGKNTSTSGTDTRPVNFFVQSTKVNYWEFPVLAHYYGLGHTGLRSRAYLSGGLQFRHLGRIRTGNDSLYANGTEGYNEDPAQPDRSNQLGFVAGIGLRFIDNFNIKATPEIRYVRWMGSTFQGPAYHSMATQVEIGFGLAF